LYRPEAPSPDLPLFRVKTLPKKSEQGGDPHDEGDEDEDDDQPFPNPPGDPPENPGSIRTIARTMKRIPRVRIHLSLVARQVGD